VSWRGVAIPLLEGGLTVHPGRGDGVAEAGVKGTRGVSAGHDPVAAHHVVNVLAIEPRIRIVRVADPDTELAVAHEVHPLFDLPDPSTERRREHQATDRVTVTRCAVRVKFSASVAADNVNRGAIELAGDLYVRRRLDEMGAQDRPWWNNPRPTTGSRAPRHFELLRLPNLAIRVWRCPKAKVLQRVDIRSLTH
jgi:hypothetical protein